MLLLSLNLKDKPGRLPLQTLGFATSAVLIGWTLCPNAFSFLIARGQTGVLLWTKGLPRKLLCHLANDAPTYSSGICASKVQSLLSLPHIRGLLFPLSYTYCFVLFWARQLKLTGLVHGHGSILIPCGTSVSSDEEPAVERASWGFLLNGVNWIFVRFQNVSHMIWKVAAWSTFPSSLSFVLCLPQWQMWRFHQHCASPCCSWYSSWPQVSPSVDIESSIKQHIERQRTRLIACKLSDSFFCFFLSFVCSLWEEGGVRRVAERHTPYAASVQQQDMQRALHRRGRHQGKMRLAHR